jgi:hypothetical protein
MKTTPKTTAKKLATQARAAAPKRNAIRLAPGNMAGTFRLVADKSNTAPIIIAGPLGSLTVPPGTYVICGPETIC